MIEVTDTAIKQQGLEALGEVNAERFITLLTRDPFDYTVWQRNLFGKVDINEISATAMELN